MLDQKYIKQLREYLHGYARKRLQAVELSNQAIHHAKRAIFALHRDDKKGAKLKLRQAEALLFGIMEKDRKDLSVLGEGAYRAAVEEYVEAKLFFDFLLTGKIGKVPGLLVEPEAYIAGLCDVPGELYRYALKCATAGELETTRKCVVAAQEIMGELIEFNLTSYLRTKFDQAKQAVHKLEQVLYELSVRR